MGPKTSYSISPGMEEWHDAQNQLSGERNARILQEGILANHLAKQKQKEMADKEMNS